MYIKFILRKLNSRMKKFYTVRGKKSDKRRREAIFAAGTISPLYGIVGTFKIIV